MDQGESTPFKRWLVTTYAKQDNALGDLARETEGDRCWPRTNNRTVLRAHLEAHDSCSRVQELFEQAYELYEASGLHPTSGRTDEEELRARMRLVLKRPAHFDRQQGYTSAASEIRALLPGDTDLSVPRSVREIAMEWAYPRTGRTGSVYFIQSGSDGPVKIGFAGDPGARLKTLQTGHPEVLVIRAVLPDRIQADEKDLHERFRHLWIQGEWFRPGPDLMAYIKKAGQADDD